ncbi:beta-glucosidase [Motilibacter peucedani]|uniref:Beta-glucosidase n=1 Tax=Motilibacter peucedani TaxID=598650 RepID=A0A420XL76_9ACTN|nr:GH1 family beta-glucosidase [Motilibacter peucedani]RKS69185.1 beta-glucosidase [Motilibacter peucedani]
MTSRDEFPADFAWGTATASYQIEGATCEDGRSPSIWDTFAATPGAIADGTTGDLADDHYHRWAEDVAIMADLGVNAYRYSLSWSRLLPEGSGRVNRAGVDFYRRLTESLLAHGLAPWVTLYHWDLPQVLEDRGGWLERDTAYRFADYAAAVHDALGDLVSSWITLNEPWCSAFLGYGSGVHAPGQQVGTRSAHAAHHLLLGHGLAVDVLRAADPEAQVGITVNLYSVEPASGTAADRDAARRIDGLQNRFFLEPVLRGAYPADVLEDLGEQEWFAAQPAADLELVSRPLDFLGINYYSRHTVAAPAPDGAGGFGPSFPGSEGVRAVDTGAPRTHMGWPVCPEGMLDVLRQAHTLAPELPLCITENGSAWPDEVSPDGAVHDPERTDYLATHVAACAAARAEGLPLQGYFAWTLMDNWEWAWGQSRRFGLVHVDYGTQARTLKDSGDWLRTFLRGEGAG